MLGNILLVQRECLPLSSIFQAILILVVAELVALLKYKYRLFYVHISVPSFPYNIQGCEACWLQLILHQKEMPLSDMRHCSLYIVGPNTHG